MSDSAGRHWTVAEFFVVRTPYLPLETLFALGDGLEAAENDETAAERDRTRVRKRLEGFWDRADVKEAIYLASPSLARSLDEWRSVPSLRRRGRLERGLLRYLSRMAGRPTPFGLFAGWSIGCTGMTTRVELLPKHAYRRHTSLDCGYIDALGQALKDDLTVSRRLTYVPNPTLYEAAGHLRYVEARRNGYHLVIVDPDPILRGVLDRAAGGGQRDELAADICRSDTEIDKDEACGFVADLISQQVLVCDLGRMVTGPDPLEGLLKQLAELAPHPVIEALEKVRGLLKELDSEPPGVHLARYQQVASVLESLPAAGDPLRLVRSDLIKPAIATLGSDVIDEIKQGAELLCRIGGGANQDSLAPFRNDFRRRYGDREVPLWEALDEEYGVGFPASATAMGGAAVGVPGAASAVPLLAGLRFPPIGEQARARYGPREELLSRWINTALHEDVIEIALGSSDVAALEATCRPVSLPDAFSAMATILARDAAAVDSGCYRIHISGIGGPSGANLLGRFCAGDETLTEHVRTHLRAEEALRPDSVFAEIVHLPEGRMGNVLTRPAVRNYEIPFLGGSGVPHDRQIPISDLLVSVVGDRVLLRSRRLGLEVIPRLTAAHNFGGPKNLGMYRFLCALQSQGTVSGLAFSFGALDSIPRLPRVTVGKVVLSRARWNLTADDLGPLCRGADSARYTAMQEIRRRLRIPRWVAFVEGDRMLPIDLSSALFLDVAVDLFKGRRQATLVEQFYGPDDVLVSGPEGHFVHELVVPFVRRAGQPVLQPAMDRRPTLSHAVPRRFPPGSEWLYAKIYTGTVGVDRVLRQVVRPLIERALQSGAVDRWFFVRHGDPDWHLRLRLHGESARLLGEVMPSLLAGCAPHIANGLVWRVQLDTYEREVERYGGPEGIELAERVFGADSEAVLSAIESLEGDDVADARWRLAVVGIDRLLADLGLDLAGCYAVASAARDRFGREFRSDVGLRRQLGEKFRQERRGLERMLARDMSDPFSPYAVRSSALKPIAADLRGIACGDDRLETIAGSLVHMHANRLLSAAARQQELVIYEFLSRLYGSKIARRKA